MENNKSTSVFNVLLSSSVPLTITPEQNSREFTNADLAMKLHYLRSLYFFSPESMAALPGFPDFKDPSLSWLDFFYETCGRVRRKKGEEGRVFLKCNDGGIRYIEAQCGMTVKEWMEGKSGSDDDTASGLVSGEALGPSLFFSPFVYLQVTRFKCGGVSLGLSWAHIMGDAFSAIDYINTYGLFLSGQRPQTNPKPNIISQPEFHHIRKTKICKEPLSVKRVDPVGDHWILPASHSPHMDTHSFHFTAERLAYLRQSINSSNEKGFEIICALVWKSLAKIAGSSFKRTVTICKKDDERGSGNTQRIGTLVPDFGRDLADAELSHLVDLISSKVIDETELINEGMGMENAKDDFIIYGANLTFVDMEEVGVYDMEINGHKPVFVDFKVVGVGEEGVVLVFPMSSENNDCDYGDAGDLMVNVTMPTARLAELKRELRIQWGIN